MRTLREVGMRCEKNDVYCNFRVNNHKAYPVYGASVGGNRRIHN